MYSLLAGVDRGSSLELNLEDLLYGLGLLSPHSDLLMLDLTLIIIGSGFEHLLFKHCTECHTCIILFILHVKIRVVHWSI